jgi:site-specific DNA recombinase
MPTAMAIMVPPEWRFQDKGYSGATLLRPGLEALRDLAAAGHIQADLVFSPDRLSRKYAYQLLLMEELSRCGVEVVFLKAPSGVMPEDQLLVQFQGMIAEYERAQIAERSRRGKRHRAQQVSINVCRAPLTVTAISTRVTPRPRITKFSNPRLPSCAWSMRPTRSKG